MQFVKFQALLSRLSIALLLAQPFFTFPVFLSVLQGAPPLWLSWLIAIVPWPLRFLLTGHFTRRTPFDIPILILTGGILFGFFLSPDRQLAMQFLHTYLTCVLFYYGIVNNSHARLGYWVSITVLLFLVLFSLTVWVFVGGVGRHLAFNTWAYELASSLRWSLTVRPTNNVLGGAFAVVTPGLVAIAFSWQRAWIRWSAIVLAILSGCILVLSVSGGGWIATIASIFVVLFLLNVKVFWSTFLALGVTAGATFPIWRNIDWAAMGFCSGSVLGRIERWQATLVVLKDSPLTGLGLGGWWSKVAEHNVGHCVHNAYLQLYSDTGVLGIVALVVAVIIGVKLFRQILHSDKGNPYYGITLGIAAGVIAGGIHALIDDNMNVIIPIGNEYTYFAVPLLWLWAALLVVSHQELSANASTIGRRVS